MIIKTLWIAPVCQLSHCCIVKLTISLSAVGAELPLNAIIFHELLHEGTFKTVHRAIVNYHPRGMSALEVAVKRLKGL